ncbi:hypothetical protein O7606_08700 [Micromonospora sp. WMMD882]|uniref:hypothetical protein n=1 Tax=Micromonospora sp. WMMD882 TaxID=3015151 RepID=UPI00248AFFC0|nr:hypothetical protein [Micromonospora sp. WMMD882]WBB81423.1 hypothetical protein O7606_08700 [Micromonospora sp. WMMD882]
MNRLRYPAGRARSATAVLTALLVTAALTPLTGAAPATAAARPTTAGPSTDRATPPQARPAATRTLSVRGAGPYRIGRSLDGLTAAGLIDSVAPGCGDVLVAGATGQWAGVILLTFRAGRLVAVGTATRPPSSPAGAGVGMTFDDLERIYGPRGALVHDEVTGRSAYLVRIGDRVELFSDHPIRDGVGYFEAGLGSHLAPSSRAGRAC